MSELYPKTQMVLLILYIIKRIESFYLEFQNSSSHSSFSSQEIHLWIFFCPYTWWRGEGREVLKLFLTRLFAMSFTISCIHFTFLEGLSEHSFSSHWLILPTMQACQLMDTGCNWHGPPGRHVLYACHRPASSRCQLNCELECHLLIPLMWLMAPG